MMQYYETVNKETRDGFEIVFSVTHEDTHPRDLFDDSIDDINELCKKIDNGEYAWFIARVQAFKNGVLLGEEHLGGCLYDTCKDFIKESGGYYDDMVFNVIKEAKQKITLLAESLQTA
jgi:hypothetical protein